MKQGVCRKVLLYSNSIFHPHSYVFNNTDLYYYTDLLMMRVWARYALLESQVSYLSAP